MSISSDLSKILKKAGVNPNLYDTDGHGFNKDWKSSDHFPKNKEKDDEDDCDSKYEKKNKSRSLDIPPLQEDQDRHSRIENIKTSDEDKALKLIFQWTRGGALNFDEFENLLAEVVKKIHSQI